ncbi:ectoine/hydroxyectoine ABC transporter permease subunit EhuD [Siminovitchia terrae]|uniref:ectoine/hydroxyectoine ABC transporter permease subunit EhuD n=1 Tax=Siminovitchia terrae TaxID=1914933 RepID=UPI0028AD98AD|nr:ectoine/hydroxyectoine ABC transporter permease subunit EhuD [Siminovitchia terrae]
MTWDWNFAIEIFPRISKAMWITLGATVAAYLIALTLGLVLTLLRRSSFKPLKWLTVGFIEFVRSTPPLVQLFFLFYALPEIPYIGFSLSPFMTGALGLGIHYSTYVSEIYRSGIDSIPKSQWEAATALNFSKAHTWMKVILPQAIPPVIPMLGNYLIVLFKETPLLSAILVVEMLQTAKIIGSETWRYLEPITIVGLLFLLLSYPSSLLIQYVERKVNRSRSRQQTNKGVSA